MCGRRDNVVPYVGHDGQRDERSRVSIRMTLLARVRVGVETSSTVAGKISPADL